MSFDRNNMSSDKEYSAANVAMWHPYFGLNLANELYLMIITKQVDKLYFYKPLYKLKKLDLKLQYQYD